MIYNSKYGILHFERGDDMFSDLIYQQCPMPEKYHCARNRTVDSVVIHYAAGIVHDAKYVVDFWLTKDYTSANYVIDVMGRISGVIPEEQRAFTTGTYFNPYRDDIDDHAITIEVSCDNNETYTVPGVAIDALTKLLADIGERYGIYWKFTGDKTGNVHAHRWYQHTPCPGDYLFGKFDIIVDIANYILYKKEEISLDNIENRLDVLESYTLPAYHSLEDVPDYWQKEVRWCIEHGFLKGDGNGDLNLSYEELRSLVIAARMVME